MSKLQLLYEKLMKMMYIFAGIFFVLFLIVLFIAISTNAFDCASVALCVVKDEHLFVKVSLYPISITTIILIIAGRVFYGLAHKESDLMSVSEYRRTLEENDTTGQQVSRDELANRFRSKEAKSTNPVISKLSKKSETVADNKLSKKEEKALRKKENKAAKEKLKLARKTEKELLAKIEAEKRQEEESKKARKKLNKTELILYVAEVANLSQNDARKFINSFTDIIRKTVENEEEVKIAKFGKFSKEHVEETTETNPVTKVEKVIEAHNTVEFNAYKAFLDVLNDTDTVEEFIEEDEVEETVVEEVVEKTVEETVVEETVKETVVEETVVEKAVEEEPAKETIVEETVEEEPVKETVVEKAVEEEPVKETVVEEAVVEETVVKEEEVENKESLDDLTAIPNEKEKKEEKKVKAKVKKKKAKSRTKTDIINLMDQNTDLSKNKANKFLKFFAEVVQEQLVKGEDVDLEGIGYFTTIEMPAKEAVNPQTQEKIIVPSHNQVRLRFNDDLKDKMNQ